MNMKIDMEDTNYTINYFITTLSNRNLDDTGFSKTCRTKLIGALKIYDERKFNNKGNICDVLFSELASCSHWTLGNRTEKLYMNHLSYIGYSLSNNEPNKVEKKYNFDKIGINIERYPSTFYCKYQEWNSREVAKNNIEKILKSQIIRYYNTFNNLPPFETMFFIEEIECAYILKSIILQEDDSFILIFDIEQ